eukprot:429342-Prorocentrum_minimum.AAC.2
MEEPEEAGRWLGNGTPKGGRHPQGGAPSSSNAKLETSARGPASLLVSRTLRTTVRCLRSCHRSIYALRRASTVDSTCRSERVDPTYLVLTLI